MDDSRPWLKDYSKGVPANIDADKYATMLDFFGDCVKKYGKNPAFSCLGKTITYNQLDKLSTRFGAYLQSRGMRKGDRIALMMPNLLQYPVAIIGCFKAGLVIVNTNPLYTPREMSNQFNDSGATAILISHNFAANLEKILPDTQIRTVIVTTVGEMLGPVKGWFVNMVTKYIKRKVPRYDLPNAVSFNEALNRGKRFNLEEFEGSTNDTVLLQYTGGTTGISKGAMLTNRNLVANMLQVEAIMKPQLQEGKEVTLCPLPMYHSFAFTVNGLAMMSMGHHVVMIVNPRDLSLIVKAFRKYPISLVTGVNTQFNGLCHDRHFARLDFSSLKVVAAGGMALQKHVAEKWQQITGCPISEGYGLTEASPVVAVNPIDGKPRLGTVGQPVPSTDVRVTDEQGNQLPFGQKGELEVKGPQVMKGYYQRPDETGKVLHEGWLKTGDVAIIREDGYIEIIDRLKDMINVSGFNVYPNDIEEVIAGHPKVSEVAAIGIPNEKSGECVKIFVVKKDKKLNEKELLSWCREQLTAYKVPKEVEFRDKLPRTNVGKILRRKLREEELNNKK